MLSRQQVSSFGHPPCALHWVKVVGIRKFGHPQCRHDHDRGAPTCGRTDNPRVSTGQPRQVPREMGDPRVPGSQRQPNGDLKANILDIPVPLDLRPLVEQVICLASDQPQDLPCRLSVVIHGMITPDDIWSLLDSVSEHIDTIHITASTAGIG